MIIYLYGLVLGRSAHLVPAHITGVGAATLRVIACEEEGLGALVSTLDRAPQRASLDDVRAHDHALQSVVHHGSTAAAVRFGQTFASDDEIRRHVAEGGGRVARLLHQYDGCVEMRLLMALSPVKGSSATPDVADAVGPGRAYLERLKNSGAGERLEGLGLRDSLGPVVRAELVEELPLARGVVFSHLILRQDESAYREAISALPALAEASIVGPLALYSFAEPAE